MSLSVAKRSISASSSSENVEPVERAQVRLELLDARRADERRGHARVAQRPSERHRRRATVPARAAISARPRTFADRLVRELVLGEGEAARDPRVLGDAVRVAVGEEPLGERREADAADAELAERVEQAALDPPVEHRVRRLVDQERRAEPVEDLGRLARALGGVRRDARVERLALADGARRARPSSPRAASRGRSGASRRCRRSRDPGGGGSGRGSRAGTSASPTRRTARATCRSRPSSRRGARRGTGARSVARSRPNVSSAEPYGGP